MPSFRRLSPVAALICLVAATPLSGDVVTGADSAATGTVVAVVAEADDASEGRLDLVNVSGTFQSDEALTSDSGGAAVTDGTLFDDPDMGYSFSRPAVVRSNDDSNEWVVIFGNGYNSEESHAMLYVLDAAGGRLIRKIDTGAANCPSISGSTSLSFTRGKDHRAFGTA